MLQSSDVNLKKLIKTASKNFIQFLCDCFLNVVNGNVAINKKLIETHKKIISKNIIKTNRFEGKEKNFLQRIRIVENG